MELWQEGLLETLSGIAAVLYLVVGYVQVKRPVTSKGRLARNSFVLWWAGLGVLGLYGILTNTVLDTSGFSLGAFRVVIYTLIPVIFIALAGLVYYLLYLYTGNRRLYVPVAVFYALLTVAFVLFVELQDPFVGPDAQTGENGLQYASEAPTWAGALFSLSFVLPPFAAAVAYFALIFRTKDTTVRYRIGMVSGGIALWMGFSLLGTLSRAASGTEEAGFGSQLTSQILGILSAMLVLLAYYPPKFMQRAFQLKVLGQSASDDDAAPVDLLKKDREGRVAPPTVA